MLQIYHRYIMTLQFKKKIRLIKHILTLRLRSKEFGLKEKLVTDQVLLKP